MWATIAKKRVRATVEPTMSCFGLSNNHNYCLTNTLTISCNTDDTNSIK